MMRNARRLTVRRSTSSGTEDDVEESKTDELEPWCKFLLVQWTEEERGKAKLSQCLAQWQSGVWRWAAGLLEKGDAKWSAVATNWQPLVHSGYVAAADELALRKDVARSSSTSCLLSALLQRHWCQSAPTKHGCYHRPKHLDRTVQTRGLVGLLSPSFPPHSSPFLSCQLLCVLRFVFALVFLFPLALSRFLFGTSA